MKSCALLLMVIIGVSGFSMAEEGATIIVYHNRYAFGGIHDVSVDVDGYNIGALWGTQYTRFKIKSGVHKFESPLGWLEYKEINFEDGKTYYIEQVVNVGGKSFFDLIDAEVAEKTLPKLKYVNNSCDKNDENGLAVLTLTANSPVSVEFENKYENILYNILSNFFIDKKYLQTKGGTNYLLSLKGGGYSLGKIVANDYISLDKIKSEFYIKKGEVLYGGEYKILFIGNDQYRMQKIDSREKFKDKFPFVDCDVYLNI